MNENNAFALLVVSIVLACGSIGIQSSPSETLTIWSTTTYTTTYISTYTILSQTYVRTTSSVIMTYTEVRNLMVTSTNYPATISQEQALHYSDVCALIIQVVLPPSFIPLPTEYLPGLYVTIHYRSPRNMVLEEIDMDTWTDLKSSSGWHLYWVTRKVNITEGTGALHEFEFIDANETKYEYVYLSKEGSLPDVVSVDLQREYKDAATRTYTDFGRTWWWTAIVVSTQTVEETYIETKTHRTFVISTISQNTFTPEKTFTPPTTSYIPPSTTVTTLTFTPTRTPTAIPGIDMLGFLGVVAGVIIVAIGIALLIWKRRRAKPAPFVPPPPLPPPAPPPI